MKRLLTFLIMFTLSAGLTCVCACSKDAAIGMYNAMLMSVGDNSLTRTHDLHGTRKFGTDSYAGTYEATLDDASFRERLFGNTSVERKDGYHMEIIADFDASRGNAAMLLQQDDGDPESLFEGTGHFETEVDLGPGSAYFILDTDKYTGDISISIK